MSLGCVRKTDFVFTVKSQRTQRFHELPPSILLRTPQPCSDLQASGICGHKPQWYLDQWRKGWDLSWPKIMVKASRDIHSQVS